MRDLPAGTVTLLFTDIKGSTRLLRTLGSGGYADALAEHRRILHAAFDGHGGVEVDTQGDAFFVAFANAPDAVAAAAQAQSALDVADQLGRAQFASERARDGLRLCREVGDRQTTVYTLALLARFARTAGRAERAGVLWAAIEAEEARGPIGHWDRDRDEIAASVLVHSPEFESGRSAGRSMSLDEAITYALDQT